MQEPGIAKTTESGETDILYRDSYVMPVSVSRDAYSRATRSELETRKERRSFLYADDADGAVESRAGIERRAA